MGPEAQSRIAARVASALRGCGQGLMARYMVTSGACLPESLYVATLDLAGNIVGAAQLLGITRHALKRRMIKLRIDRPGNTSAGLEASP